MKLLPSSIQICLYKLFNSINFTITGSSSEGLFCFDEQAVEPERDSTDHYEPPYKLLISEVNLDNPGPNEKLFLELEPVNRPFPSDPGKSDLEGFLLIIGRGDPLQVVLSVEIGPIVKKVTKKYLIIGTKDVPNVDININSDDVASIFPKHQSLPDFDGSPYAIMILYSQLESELAEVSLEMNDAGAFNALSLADERRQRIVRNNLVDMLVIGRKAAADPIPFFQSLKPPGCFIT